jgi:exodeoxyribonuclease VII large subunit
MIGVIIISLTLSVTGLNNYIKSIISGDKNLSSIYVQGEISNFTNHYKTGHFYFSLKDESSLIRAVMFKTYAQRLKFLPENGMKVIARGNVSVFERDGQYQLYIEDMQPDGAGALHIAFEQLKQRLSDEGLFEQEYKKPLPKMPQRIGIITSPTGAAIRDILNILKRRYPICKVLLFPVLVQGDGAPAQIVNAINTFNNENNADVLIIGRGGGSIEELLAFNSENVARAIFHSKIPVISAIGHETDFTIADFVSDLRAPTPSAAAELVAPDILEIAQKIGTSKGRMKQSLTLILSNANYKLQTLEKSLKQDIPVKMIDERKLRLDYNINTLSNEIKMQLVTARSTLSNLAGRLDALSPLSVLSRGYSITMDKHMNILKSINELSVNDNINISLNDGSVNCTVNSILERVNID